MENEKRETHLLVPDAVINGKEETVLELAESEVGKVKGAIGVCPVNAITIINL